jgi:hypothetical protein
MSTGVIRTLFDGLPLTLDSLGGRGTFDVAVGQLRRGDLRPARTLEDVPGWPASRWSVEQCSRVRGVSFGWRSMVSRLIAASSVLPDLYAAGTPHSFEIDASCSLEGFQAPATAVS